MTTPLSTMSPRTRREKLRGAIAARIAAILFLRWGRRNATGLIVLFGRKLSGNHVALVRYLRAEHPEIEIAHLIDSRSEYLKERRISRLAVLDSGRLRDLARVASSRAIISAGGPSNLRSWLTHRKRPLFVDAWHGVGFKSRIASASDAFRSYDAHFVSSPHVREYYESHGGKAAVTGYARTDSLLAAERDRDTRSTLARIIGAGTRQLVLYAPTWGSKVPVALSDEPVLAALNEMARELGFAVGYRPHPYGKRARTEQFEHVHLLGVEWPLSTEELLRMTDVLVSDWSSIASDFHALARPVIYLAALPPGSDLGPLDASDRVGEIVADIDALSRAVSTAVTNPNDYVKRFEEARVRTLTRAWGDTLDGMSAARYMSALDALELQQGTL